MHKYIGYISDLLFLHDCVIIPDFGGFICNHRSASINEKTGVICPPAKDIAFNKNLTHNDGLLANWIAIQENIPYEKASRQIMLFSEDLKVRLNQGQRIDFEGIGTFYTDKRFNIIFENSRYNFFADTFGMEPIALKPSKQLDKQQAARTATQQNPITSKLKSPHHLVQRLFKYGMAGAVVAGIATVSQLDILQNDTTSYGTRMEHTTNIQPSFDLQKHTEGPAFSHTISPECDYLEYDPLNDLLE